MIRVLAPAWLGEGLVKVQGTGPLLRSAQFLHQLLRLTAITITR